jgi:hypothetical protein
VDFKTSFKRVEIDLWKLKGITDGLPFCIRCMQHDIPDENTASLSLLPGSIKYKMEIAK